MPKNCRDCSNCRECPDCHKNQTRLVSDECGLALDNKTPLLESVIQSVIAELKSAEVKFPRWPDNPIHGAAIVAEESGELVQAALQHCYQQKDAIHMQEEAIQTAAMAIRFLLWLRQRNKQNNLEK